MHFQRRIFFCGIGLLVFSKVLLADQGLVVPFENIFLTRGNTIVANFVFKPYRVIFCYNNNTESNNPNVGIITWPHLGLPQTAFLPVSLTRDSLFQGFPADASGVIKITNNTNSYLIVSCLFAF